MSSKKSKLSEANAGTLTVDTDVETDTAQSETDEQEFVVSNPFLPERVKPANYVSTGITPLNLSLTNHPLCGIEKGTYALVVGSSSGGKSLTSLTILAEAANNPAFDGYALLYGDCEGGVGFDIRAFFGNKLADRMEFPRMKNGEPFQTVEDFYASVDSYQRSKTSFIYVLDSMDCLSSTAELQKFDANIAEREKNLGDVDKQYTSVSMGYTDGKAKANSSNLRRIRNRLPVTGSILIIISQERNAIGGSISYKTRSGGDALTYYADYEIWLDLSSKIEKTFDGIKRQIGQITRARIKKNRITGNKTDVLFPTFTTVGISDSDAILDWLIQEKGVTVGKSGSITLSGQKEMSRNKCIEYFENNPETAKELAEKHWHTILKQITVERKKKYE